MQWSNLLVHTKAEKAIEWLRSRLDKPFLKFSTFHHKKDFYDHFPLDFMNRLHYGVYNCALSMKTCFHIKIVCFLPTRCSFFGVDYGYYSAEIQLDTIPYCVHTSFMCPYLAEQSWNRILRKHAIDLAFPTSSASCFYRSLTCWVFQDIFLDFIGKGRKKRRKKTCLWLTFLLKFVVMLDGLQTTEDLHYFCRETCREHDTTSCRWLYSLSKWNGRIYRFSSISKCLCIVDQISI